MHSTIAGRTSLHVAAVALLFGGLARPADRQRQYSLSADSRLVLVPVTVTDRNGRSLTDLDPAHFRVFDNSEPREIHSFAREDGPVSVGIVMDRSGSMHHKLRHAISAVRAIAGSIGPEDEAFLMTFAEKPVMQSALTRESGDFANLLDSVGAEGDTALIDAVYSALHEMRAAGPRRKALVVISDGGDNHSRFRESELMARAMEADTQIYSISIVENLRNREEQNGAHLLESLAEATGGLHFTVRNRRELPEVAAKLGRAMKNVYVIGYRPPESATPGKWRKIRVTLEGLSPARLSARSGYYATD
jgi:Ca-activated chloride channel family protein